MPALNHGLDEPDSSRVYGLNVKGKPAYHDFLSVRLARENLAGGNILEFIRAVRDLGHKQFSAGQLDNLLIIRLDFFKLERLGRRNLEGRVRKLHSGAVNIAPILAGSVTEAIRGADLFIAEPAFGNQNHVSG